MKLNRSTSSSSTTSSKSSISSISFTDPEVFSITEAKVGISDDQKGRQRRYLIGMSLRTVCFVGATIAQGTLRWVLIAGAVFLPYFAVVIANAGRERMLVDPIDGVTAVNKRAITNTAHNIQ